MTSPHASLLRWIALLAIATLAAYLPALRAGWVWDDNHYVTDNIQLRSLHGLRQIWLRPRAEPQYYPVTHTSFWIEYHLWGTHPLGYHLDNVLLHIANAVLVGMILRRLALPGYGLAAIIFALHPVHVESVAWITERKNVLSGLFYLLALWTALDVWQIGRKTQACLVSDKAKLEYLICLGLFVLSLLSKSVTATLPAILFLLIWWKRGRISWRQAASLLPFFGFAAAMGSVTVWMEEHVVGAVGDDWNWTVAQRVLIAGRAAWFYLGKLLWPHPLTFVYHKWQVDSTSSAQWMTWIAWAVLLAILYLSRRRVGRGPLTGLLFFLITLTPALGFFNVYPMRYSFVADHFQYLASIGPIALAAALLPFPRIPLTAALTLVLGFLTWRQASVYAGAETLWRDVAAKDPQSIIGHCNLGIALRDRGDFSAAAAELERAITLDPQFVEAWVGLGSVAEAQGHFKEAMEYYRAAQLGVPNNPLPVWHMGLLDRRQGNAQAARSEFTEAARYLPDPAPAYEQVGEIELTFGHIAAAEDQFRLALAADPDSVDAHNNWAAAALSERNPALAEAQCQATLAIDPGNAVAANNMGIALAMEGRKAEAAAFFAQALKTDPGFQMARDNLARLAH